MRLTLKNKIIIFFSVSILFTVALLTFYMYNATNDIIRESEENLKIILTNSIEKEIQDSLDFTEVNVKSVVENQKVQELFARRDREALIEYLLPSYESVRSSFPQAHFHLPDSTSFLRLNNLKKYGDSLKDFRFTVNEANRSQRAVRGIERGVSGFGFRVVMPLFYQGKHVGSFEYGKELEYDFLQTLKKSYGGDFVLYGLDEGSAPAYVSSTTDREEVFEHVDHVDEIRRGESFYLTSRDDKYNHYIIPLKSFDGKTLGFMQYIDDRSGILEQNARAIRNLILVVASVLAVIVAVSLLFLTKAFKPLYSLVDDAAVIARGDFTKTFDLSRNDEIGMLNRSFHNISDSLKEMFGVIGAMSSDVANTSEGLSASSEELTASNEEVNRNVIGVGDLATDQLASIDEAKNSVNFMADRITELNESVKRINRAMDSVIASANDGSNASQRIEEKMRNLKSTADKATGNIEKLDSSSKEIENIITTIHGIANETNMLALNASIEAARAGEAGRGFSIVASEVGKLAEQSKNSTNSIDALIKEIQSNINLVVSSMLENNQKLEEGVQVVNESKATFKSIEEEVVSAVEQIASVTKLVESVYSRIEVLLNGFAEIVEKSGNTMSHIDTVKVISLEQTQAMTEITNSTISLAELALELKNAVSRFKY